MKTSTDVDDEHKVDHFRQELSRLLQLAAACIVFILMIHQQVGRAIAIVGVWTVWRLNLRYQRRIRESAERQVSEPTDNTLMKSIELMRSGFTDIRKVGTVCLLAHLKQTSASELLAIPVRDRQRIYELLHPQGVLLRSDIVKPLLHLVIDAEDTVALPDVVQLSLAYELRWDDIELYRLVTEARTLLMEVNVRKREQRRLLRAADPVDRSVETLPRIVESNSDGDDSNLLRPVNGEQD